MAGTATALQDGATGHPRLPRREHPVLEIQTEAWEQQRTLICYGDPRSIALWGLEVRSAWVTWRLGDLLHTYPYRVVVAVETAEHRQYWAVPEEALPLLTTCLLAPPDARRLLFALYPDLRG